MYDDVYIYTRAPEVSTYDGNFRWGEHTVRNFRRKSVTQLQCITVHVSYDSACHPGGHYWNYQRGTRSFSENTGNHLEIGYP